jgi:hypothetical protein
LKVTGDGSCLFHALRTALLGEVNAMRKLNRNSPNILNKLMNNNYLTPMRKAVANHIRANPYHFIMKFIQHVPLEPRNSNTFMKRIYEHTVRDFANYLRTTGLTGDTIRKMLQKVHAGLFSNINTNTIPDPGKLDADTRSVFNTLLGLYVKGVERCLWGGPVELHAWADITNIPVVVYFKVRNAPENDGVTLASNLHVYYKDALSADQLNPIISNVDPTYPGTIRLLFHNDSNKPQHFDALTRE